MQNKLKVNWSKKEKDLLITYPLGLGTVCDGHYIADLFNKSVVKELSDRGYDIKTLKFEISVDPNHPDFNKNFPTLAKENKS